MALIAQAMPGEGSGAWNAPVASQAGASKDGQDAVASASAGACVEDAGVSEPKDTGEQSGSSRVVKRSYKTVGDQKLMLNIYAPQGHKPEAKAPAIVFFHGGGFKGGKAEQFEKQSIYLSDRGMVAISVTYRLISEPGVQVKDCIEDAKSAMRWVRANAGTLGIDPDRLASGGGSAGGYLAVATLLLEDFNASTDPADVSAKPNAMVLFNPGLGATEKTDAGKDPRDPEGRGNLIDYVVPNLPPCINFFGTEDPLLDPARQFQEAYRKAGNRCDLLTYDGQAHSFFNKDEYRILTVAQMDKFLVEIGWLAKKPQAQAP